VLTSSPDIEELEQTCRDFMGNKSADACLGVSLKTGKEKQDLRLVVISPVKTSKLSRSYGGPPLLAPSWAVNLCLNYVRRLKHS
jgi:hypothetical protein